MNYEPDHSKEPCSNKRVLHGSLSTILYQQIPSVMYQAVARRSETKALRSVSVYYQPPLKNIEPSMVGDVDLRSTAVLHQDHVAGDGLRQHILLSSVAWAAGASAIRDDDVDDDDSVGGIRDEEVG